jgi:hypothetical protein
MDASSKHWSLSTRWRSNKGIYKQMKKWNVWMEGYVVTGNSGKAECLGSMEADTFQEACNKLLKTHSLAEYYDPKRLTVWGCRLYHTGEEAVQRFG